ncbi:hypothetical protein F5Y15DRAFT_104464 [Xylariaceae sp. FL0016]|nr:hypothetical protein F5Y15DRAFT_104464 [Xylariaceae sp. FL0016]
MASEQFTPEYLAQDRGGRVIAAVTTVLVLTTVLFGLRLVSRSLTPAKRGWDDHLLIPAYLTFLGTAIVIYVEVTKAGVGRHAVALEADQIKLYSQLLYVLFWVYVPSSMFSRVSVVVLYLRVFTDKRWRAASWGVIAYLVGICVSTLIVTQVQCTPLVHAWDTSVEGHCVNRLLWYQLTNFENILGDVMVLVLPIKTIWSLQSSFAQKVGIAGVFLTGSIGLIASSVRTSVFFVQADILTKDPTFADEAFSWTAIECAFYLSAACLIGLRPLFSKLPHIFKRGFRSRNSDVEGGVSKDADQMRLNRSYNSKYVTIGDASSNHIPLDSVATAAHPSPKHSDEQTRANGIRVETDIHVWRQAGRSYPDQSSNHFT